MKASWMGLRVADGKGSLGAGYIGIFCKLFSAAAGGHAAEHLLEALARPSRQDGCRSPAAAVCSEVGLLVRPQQERKLPLVPHLH